MKQHEDMVAAQNNCCYICGCDASETRFGTLCIDHCHATGNVRKLLCDECNHAIGNAKENPELLRKMASYLDEHSSIPQINSVMIHKPFSKIVVDLECNGLSPSIIHMVGILDIDSGVFENYHEDGVTDGLMKIIEADLIVGQNILGYDIPVIEILTDGLVKIDRKKVIDTLPMARRLFPKLKSHSLKSWGELIGIPKLTAPSFDTYTPEMAVYCEGDCRTTLALFEFLSSQQHILEGAYPLNSGNPTFRY